MKRQFWTDLLFAVQILCTLAFGGAQFVRLLATAQGVSTSWYVFWEAFILMNFSLAVSAHRTQPSRVTAQTLVSYLCWMVMITADIAVMAWKQTGEWSLIDTMTSTIATLGIVGTLVWARTRNIGISDPMAKGWLALFFKAVPQLMLAWNIAQRGGAGLTLIAIITGHVTILTRLGQLYASIKEAGWDRNRTGSAFSEAGNEVSWVVVTIAWLVAHTRQLGG